MELSNLKCILFDCINTVIAMRNQPSVEQMARWSFEGSGCENYWSDFKAFLEDYTTARSEIPKRLPQYREYEFRERLLYICRNSLKDINQISPEDASEMLYRSCWKRYTGNSYVEGDVRSVLPKIRKYFRLGVVSNFMNSGSVEELLDRHGIAHHFDFVITSINVGWRKPHENIYNAGIEMAGCEPNEILFVGDDFECDYVGPREMGMNAVLLDRNGIYGGVSDRIKTVSELTTMFDDQ